MACLVNGAGKIISNQEMEKIVKKVFQFLKKKGGDLSVNLVSEKKIRELNKQYRGKDRVTDVLSFPLSEKGESLRPELRPRDKNEKENDLGDIFICEKQVKRQAKEYRVDEKEEFKRMLAHGVLHLLGFDHQKASEAKKMFNLQEKIISLL